MPFVLQMLSRAKPAVGGESPHTDKRKKKGRKIPKLEDLLSQRDFTGAITLLEVMSKEGFLLSLVNVGVNAGYYAIGIGGYILGNPCKYSQTHIPDCKLTINLIKYFKNLDWRDGSTVKSTGSAGRCTRL